jgi:hypothetical protein
MAPAVALVAPTGYPAESDVAQRLAYVAQVSADRIFYCRVAPRSDATNPTQMLIEFDLAGVGPVAARMIVTGSVRGDLYRARISWRGTAGPSGEDGQDALIVLDEVAGFDPDPLPGKARWSDPAGDTITLRVDPAPSGAPRPFVLSGTQETEFGINDLACIDGERPIG